MLHVGDEVENLVRVTDLIVIPRHNLNEGRGQLDTGLCVEDRCAYIAKEVRRNNCIFGVTEDSFVRLRQLPSLQRRFPRK